jgi:hypothetical protein
MESFTEITLDGSPSGVSSLSSLDAVTVSDSLSNKQETTATITTNTAGSAKAGT